MNKTYEQLVTNITIRLRDLSLYAEKLAFPKYDEYINRPQLKLKYRFQEYFFFITHPFNSSFKIGFWLYFGLFLSVCSIIAALRFTDPYILQISQITINSFPPTTTGTSIVIILSLLTGLYNCIVAIFWWIYTLQEKTLPIWIKIGSIILTILPQLLLLNYIFINQYCLPIGFFPFVFILLLLIFPIITLLVSILIGFIKLVLIILLTVFGEIKAIHEPRSIGVIQKLTQDKIPHVEIKTIKKSKSIGVNRKEILDTVLPEELIKSENENLIPSPWTLVGLEKTELQTIHKWAEANRSGSEKRTIPIYMLIGILGLVLTNDDIQDIISKFFNKIILYFSSNSLSNFKFDTIFSVFTGFILLFVILFILINLMALFRNIVAQNLIIEACIIAEYAQAQQESESLQNSSDSKPTFCKRIINFFKISNIAK